MSAYARKKSLERKYKEIQHKIKEENTRPHPDDSVLQSLKHVRFSIENEISRLGL